MTLRSFAFLDKGPGLIEAIEAAGITIARHGAHGWRASDPGEAARIAAAYDPLPWLKARKQAALDALFDARFDVARFMRDGTATAVTGAQVGAFLAAATNRYRLLRAAILAASDAAALDAVDLDAGWPANP